VNFDATTFVLEVANFLVLVWLLRRFFYRPVLAVIEQRRADGARVLATAQASRDEAQALKTDYEARLAQTAQAREQALARLSDEIATERARRLAALEAEMQAGRQRREALQERAREAQDAERERQAAALAARFASRLLERAAGPALDDRLVELALADLQALPAGQRETLRATLADPAVEVQVCTAYPLGATRREAISAALSAAAGRALAPTFHEEPLLEAGLRIHAGDWVLMANLRDELAHFGSPSANGH
jgi:F-type H+-transporting ATPase subunit b